MRALLLSFIAVTLAACSPPASTTAEGPGQETSASAAASSPGSQMRLGRWRKVMTVMGDQTTEVDCITTTDLNQMASEPNSQCTSANGFQRTAEGLVYEADCTGEDGGGHIRTVLNGDLRNNYVADVAMTGAGMSGGMQIHIEGTYEGACRGDE
ncbi:MAG: DUF3617 family protein [Hyphomonadaceae bacterium]|nr:DUF3617 family protein [Hyphomonadaceae bacterium]